MFRKPGNVCVGGWLPMRLPHAKLGGTMIRLFAESQYTGFSASMISYA